MSADDKKSLQVAEKPSLNPSQADYDSKFNDIVGQPDIQSFGDQQGAMAREYENRQTSDARDETAKKELGDTAAGQAAMAGIGAAGSPIAAQAAKLLSKVKVKGVGGALIVGVILAGIGLATSFLAPSMVLINLKEVMTRKFDDITAVIDERSDRIFIKKLGGDITTAGCKVKVMCRYEGFSKRQIKNLEKVPIKVNTNGKTLLGYTKVSSLELPNGKIITAKNFRSETRGDPVTRKFLRVGFNPKFSSLSTRLSASMKKVALRNKFTQAQNITGNTPEDLDKSLTETIDGTSKHVTSKLTPIINDKGEVTGYEDSSGGTYTPDQADKLNSMLDEIDQQVTDVKKTGLRAALSLAKSSILTTMTGGLAVTDFVCGVYGTVKAVGYGAKLIVAAELIRFTYGFMNTSDAEMASYLSNINPKVVEHMAKKVVATDSNGKSGTDSFGYKYAAYGDTALPSSDTPEGQLLRANIFQFSTAAGLGASITGFLAKFNSYLGGAPNTTCKGIKNPWSQGGLFIGGILLTVFTGGVNLTTGTAATIAASLVFGVIVSAAIPTMSNIAAGSIVTKDTKGPDAVNAITSGMGALNAQRGQAFGLSILHKKKVRAYDQKRQELLALDDQMIDRFDISNPSSLISKTVMPIVNTVASSNLWSLPQKLIATVPSRVTPNTYAQTPAEEVCTDFEYNEKGLGTDPFCNLRFGLTEESLAQDSKDIAQYMIDNNLADPETGAPISGSDYDNFVKDCIDRVEPWGGTGEDFQGEDGLFCMQDDPRYEKVFDKYRVFYVDTDILGMMDEESLGTPLVPDDSSSDLTKSYLLSSSVDTACASGTTDRGIDDGYYSGILIKIRLCSVDGMPSSGSEDAARGGMVTVNSKISANYVQMFQAMKATVTNPPPKATSTFRSMAKQTELCNANPGCRSGTDYSEVARPGTSNHQMGFATDFDFGTNNSIGNCKMVGSVCTPPIVSPGYNWLVDNARKYGFGQYIREFWHWDPAVLRQ